MAVIQAVRKGLLKARETSPLFWSLIDPSEVMPDPTAEEEWVASAVTWLDDAGYMPDLFWGVMDSEGYTHEDVWTLAGEDRGQDVQQQFAPRLNSYTRLKAQWNAERKLYNGQLGALRVQRQAIETAANSSQTPRQQATELAQYALALSRLEADTVAMLDDYDDALQTDNLEAAQRIAQEHYDTTRAALQEVWQAQAEGGAIVATDMTTNGGALDFLPVDYLPAQPSLWQRIYYPLEMPDGTPFLEREIIFLSRWKLPWSKFVWVVAAAIFISIYWREIARALGFKVRKKRKSKKLLGIF